MKTLQLKIVSEDFHAHSAQRIQQGEVYVGTEEQGTILKSCTCIGFYNAGKSIAAISHITGFSQDAGHCAEGALQAMKKGLRKHGLDFSDCECFLIGGATRARYVFDQVEATLRAAGIRYKEFDILGDFHRKLMLDPKTGLITLYKKSSQAATQKARAMYSSDSSFKCFHDPKRRLITGASLFFRNASILKLIPEKVLPILLGQSNRLHVWCAGCSIGMEVYTVEMIILEYLTRNGHATDGFKVLGTDIAPDAIETAKRAEYPVSEKAAQTHKKYFDKYTTRLDRNTICMNPELTHRTTFMHRDLCQGSKNHKFEIIICDHVMQYFSAELQLEMLPSLTNALQPGGFAYISSPLPVLATELLDKQGYERVARHLYRKPSFANRARA